MLPVRSLLLAASSESGSVVFVLLSVLRGLPLPFCWLEPFLLLPNLAAPLRPKLAAELDAELDPYSPDTYLWQAQNHIEHNLLLIIRQSQQRSSLPLFIVATSTTGDGVIFLKVSKAQGSDSASITTD